jgi:hypothetical protein
MSSSSEYTRVFLLKTTFRAEWYTSQKTKYCQEGFLLHWLWDCAKFSYQPVVLCPGGNHPDLTDVALWWKIDRFEPGTVALQSGALPIVEPFDPHSWITWPLTIEPSDLLPLNHLTSYHWTIWPPTMKPSDLISLNHLTYRHWAI